MNDHDHDHEHPHAAPASPLAERVKSLEALLVAKKLVDPDALDALIDTYEHKVGPRNGAKVVARAWMDPAYQGAAAARTPRGHRGVRLHRAAGRAHGRGREHARPSTTWSSARSAPATRGRCWGCRRSGTSRRPTARARCIDPRGVLGEFGSHCRDDVEVRVWDSTAELRYLVLPERPAGTEGLSEEELAALVTRDTMIGSPGPGAGGVP